MVVHPDIPPPKESRLGPQARAKGRSRTPVPAPPGAVPRRGPAAGRTARQQGQRPPLGQDRVRAARCPAPPRGRHLTDRLAGAEKRGYQGSSMTCPHCREDARCKGLRGRAALTLLGAIRFERHYYHCRHCGRGSSPLDAALGLTAGDLTPAADEVVCLAGVQASFAEAAGRARSRLAGLRVSESTAQRATEAAGSRVEKAQAAGQTFGPAQPWAWHKDADGRTVGYVSADATGVGQQGPAPGQGAEGRMAYVGMIYNPVPPDRQRWADPHRQRPTWQARHVAQLQPLASVPEPLRRQGGQVGLDQAERWIALSDGGAGLEDFLRENFPRVEEVILDFYHVAEYVGELAKALHPGQEAEAEAWQASWCQRLKQQGGPAVLEALRALSLK